MAKVFEIKYSLDNYKQIFSQEDINYDYLVSLIKLMNKDDIINDSYEILRIAIEEDNIEVVKILLKNNIDINARIEYKGLIIKEAISKKRYDITELMLDKGASTKTESYFRGPLSTAVSTGIEFVKLLINKKANVNDEFPPLLSASSSGKKDIVEYLINSRADVNYTLPYGHSVLTSAVFSNHHEIVDILISNGARKEQKDNYGQTPLITAAISNKKESLQLLLDKNAKVDTRIYKNKKGENALICAAKNNSLECVQILLQHNASVNTTDDTGKTALHYASQNIGNIAELLVEYKANVNKTCNNGKIPLHESIIKNRYETVKLLIKEKSIINKRCRLKRTPFFYSCKYGLINLAELLINNDADYLMDDFIGVTPKKVTKNKSIIEMIEMVEQYDNDHMNNNNNID